MNLYSKVLTSRATYVVATVSAAVAASGASLKWR